MTAAATLDRAFTDLLGKVRPASEIAAAPATQRTITVNLGFSGGGSVLPESGLPGLVEVPISGQVIWAHMFAGGETLVPVDVDATVDVRVGNIASFFGPQVPIYGSGGPPSMSSASSAAIDISDWTHSLVAMDTILFRLMSFTGTATWLTLVLGIRGTDAQEGVAEVVDATGDTVIDGSGNTVTYRT